MAACKRFKLFLGFAGVMSVILLSADQLDLLQLKTGMTHQLQEQRKEHLREMCDAVNEVFPQWNRSLDGLRHAMSNFIVDDEHRIIYCYIPKVACTNWKKVMIVLSHGPPYQDPNLLIGNDAHDRNRIKFLKSNKPGEMKAKLESYTKFLFVRDPFIRLISAYRNKLQQFHQAFYHLVGRDILLKYGNISYSQLREKQVLASGLCPSFHNFIQYLIDPQTKRPLNEHWRLMHQLCHPCTIKYDFIGHQETLQEDAEQLLKMLKLEDIRFPHANENMTTTDSLVDWFKSVPIEERRKLYQMYEMDFLLFGFPKPVELLDD